MKSILSLMMVALFSAWLVTACGGGSVSGGGGSGDTRSANLIVKLGGGVSSFQFQNPQYGSNRVAAAVVDFLISEAEAQAGELVSVWTGGVGSWTLVDAKTTDGFGEAGFVVAPAGGGTYTVCIGIDPNLGEDPDSLTATCGVVNDEVTNQDVLVATVTDTGVGLAVSGMSEPREDNLALFEDEDGDLIICHVPPGNPAAAHTIVIGPPAWQAHQGHGDTLGACAGNPVIASDDDNGSEDNDSADNDSEDNDSEDNDSEDEA